MHQVARPVLVDPVLRVVEPVRVRHRVQVVQVAEELVEAVHRRQVLVQVAQVVLAELAGCIAKRLQHGGQRDRLGGHTDIGSGLADGGQTRAEGQLAGDEIGAPGGAARLGVIVGESHAVLGELVEVRRLARHDALVIGADVEPADVVAHDDEDVRLVRRLRLPDGSEGQSDQQKTAMTAPGNFRQRELGLLMGFSLAQLPQLRPARMHGGRDTSATFYAPPAAAVRPASLFDTQTFRSLAENRFP